MLSNSLTRCSSTRSRPMVGEVPPKIMNCFTRITCRAFWLGFLETKARSVSRLVSPRFLLIRPRCLGASETRRDIRESTGLCSLETQGKPLRVHSKIGLKQRLQPWKSNCKHSSVLMTLNILRLKGRHVCSTLTPMNTCLCVFDVMTESCMLIWSEYGRDKAMWRRFNAQNRYYCFVSTLKWGLVFINTCPDTINSCKNV